MTETDMWDAFAAGEPLALLVMNLHMGWTAPTEWINL